MYRRTGMYLCTYHYVTDHPDLIFTGNAASYQINTRFSRYSQHINIMYILCNLTSDDMIEAYDDDVCVLINKIMPCVYVRSV